MARSKYKPEYDVEIVAFLGDTERKNIYEAAEYFGVAYLTLLNWRKEFPSFDVAVKKGIALRKKNTFKPYKYKPTFPKKVQELMSRGKSKAAVCSFFGISYETLQDWREKYPEFKEAFLVGELMAQSHWESIGESGMLGHINGFNSSVWQLSMKTRFNYQEKTQLSGDPEAPLISAIQVEFVEKEKDEE